MGDSVIPSDEPKHFETSDTTASGNRSVGVSNAIRSGRTIGIGRYDPTENEPFGNRDVFLNQVEFPKKLSGSKCGRPGSEFFVIVVARYPSVSVFVARVAVGVGVGIEELQGVLSVPLGRSFHAHPRRIERMEASAGSHLGSVSAEAKVLSGSKISGRSDASSFPVVSESGKVRIASPDICGGEIADVRSGSHGEAVPIFFVIDYAPVLYDRHEPFDIVIKVLSQVYPVADVGSVSRDLSEALDSEHENDGQYRNGYEDFDERKTLLIGLFNEPAVFFEKEMEEG